MTDITQIEDVIESEHLKELYTELGPTGWVDFAQKVTKVSFFPADYAIARQRVWETLNCDVDLFLTTLAQFLGYD